MLNVDSHRFTPMRPSVGLGAEITIARFSTSNIKHLLRAFLSEKQVFTGKRVTRLSMRGLGRPLSLIGNRQTPHLRHRQIHIKTYLLITPCAVPYHITNTYTIHHQFIK